VLERIAGYTLAAIGACALMITTADAAGLVHAAEIKPRPSAQNQNQHRRPVIQEEIASQ
jgi:hypothetical protein